MPSVRRSAVHNRKAAAPPAPMSPTRGIASPFRRGEGMDRLGAMETFVHVVDAGSFSGAARLLRVGQPAVSKTVAQLEKRLGVRLLLRSSHSLKATEAGRSFYERAKRSIEEADEAELAARGAGAALSGRLRVFAPVAFTCLHVIPSLPVFLAEQPKLDVELMLDDRDIDLIEAGIDVALRMGELADSSLTVRKIAQKPRRPISRRWARRKRPRIWSATMRSSTTSRPEEPNGRSAAGPWKHPSRSTV